ncbi:MAG: DegT/DnrJ/EryC1/StrS family aminotransferase, partial [Paracoccaceae bacterium]
MVDIPNVKAAEPIPSQVMSEITDLMSNGDLFRYNSEGSAAHRLEIEFSKVMGVRYSLAVSSCSAALFLALKSLNLPSKARVLMPAFTFAAVPSSVIHADFIPILCECRDDYRIDLIDFKEKIKTADAVLISHMRGHTSDMDIILSECKQADIPLIEDAAHSLGTTWNGKKIGTIGDIGCFSFQSYKMLNSGEGGIFITDDPELFAKAVIMSGAYEHNWIKHQGDQAHFKKWQNKLPLYNLRINNLSAVLINAQLPELNRRIEKGRRNHDFTAEHLNTSPWISVPEKLTPEERAPDSIQFNLINLDTDEIDLFEKITSQSGLNVQIFGRTKDNARAFWNWQFLPESFELPKTRKMLMSACDVRLPSRLTLDECKAISDVILSAIS